jgi:hypothetical protein
MENDERQQLQSVEMGRGSEAAGKLDFGSEKSPKPS